MKTNTTQQNIPQGWISERFNNRIVLQYGSSLPESKRLEGTFPVYGSNGVIDKHSESLVKGPGIIVGRKGTIGAVTWSETDFWPIDTTYYIEKDNSLDLHWLYYNLQSLGLSKMNSASGTPGLNREEVYKLQIEIPPTVEQQKIAEVLGAVDDDIAKTQDVIEVTEKLKRGLMQQLFTRGIGHTKFKETRIGKIPEKWGVVKIGEVSIVTNGQVDPKHEPYKSMILVAPNHIESDSGRILGRETAEAQGAISGKYYVDKGDIIYSKIRPYLKKVALANEQCLCSADMYPIKVKDNLNIIFLFNILLSKNFTDFANNNSARTGIPKINRDELYSYEFALPPVDEQKKIAEILSAVDEKISVNKKLKEKLTLLKKGLMQDLLSGTVRTITK